MRAARHPGEGDAAARGNGAVEADGKGGGPSPYRFDPWLLRQISRPRPSARMSAAA